MKKFAQVAVFYSVVGAGIVGAGYIGVHAIIAKVIGRPV